MKKAFLVILLILSADVSIFAQARHKYFSSREAQEMLDFAAVQYMKMMEALPDSVFPRSFDSTSNKLVTSDYEWWCSGFFPGSLWYLYEYTGDNKIREAAERKTAAVERAKFITSHHDLGFMLYCSFGNGLRLTKNEKYKEILLTGAKSLATRFNSRVGCIKSWDWTKWEYPVIIDNMMNLEFLFWASRASGDPTYRRIAVSHANTTLKNHFRKDWSSYHVVTYDTLSGKKISGETAQGYSAESAWARGQSWGLYGYVMCYRETRDRKYLDAANKIAAFILNHPNLPKDKIAYWDYNAPGIPNEKRDASAAAIMCSALLELSQYVKKDLSVKYFRTAEIILSNLSKPLYCAGTGENGNFILKHSVGSIPHHSEIDVAMTYPDYYYIESLIRYLEMSKDRYTFRFIK
ncbi:MAG: glycoside hydrolase family 88 protein [Syntrophothermus sp.]